MNNLVLYRKYRPQNFFDIVAQEHIVKTIGNAISAKMVSHAYLFCGPRGTGKTTLARLLAKSVNCENRKEGDFEPCNKCNSCVEITQGRAIDLIEIDAASHRGIDEMRELKDGIRFGPTKSKYKIFIIDESHQLTKEASNALLKTLEEPPAHAIFVLATTEIHKMIPTIISRCQRFDFRKLTLQELVGQLEKICKKEDAKIEKPALELIAQNATGSSRDALSLLDQILAFQTTFKKGSPVGLHPREITIDDTKNLLGLVEIETVAKLTDFIIQKKLAEAVGFLNEVADGGMDLQEFSKAAINYLRQILILKIAGADNQILTGLGKDELLRMENQSKNFKEEDLQKIINFFLEAENKMRYSSIPQLPLELAIIESIGFGNGKVAAGK
ncbi:MAG: DNA polymerase III subunit gamma/tau [Patescibacteria group bacterium]